MMLKRLLITLAASVVALSTFGAVDEVAFAAAGTDTEQLIARASDGHAYLMRGDIEGYRRSLLLVPDFTLMDPFGGTPTGAPKSDAHWKRIGAFFRNGRDAAFEPITSYASQDMIVLVAKEHAHVAVGSLPAQDWSLRVTLVFRRNTGVWRLVHRHADPLANGIPLDKAGVLARGGDLPWRPQPVTLTHCTGAIPMACVMPCIPNGPPDGLTAKFVPVSQLRFGPDPR